MILKIIRIEEHVITCEIEGETIIDIGRKWFPKNIKEDDIIEFDVTDRK